MILFHGGIEIVKSPLILDSQRFLDFGKGFYTTTNREQSENWAVIKQKRDAKSTQETVRAVLYVGPNNGGSFRKQFWSFIRYL